MHQLSRSTCLKQVSRSSATEGFPGHFCVGIHSHIDQLDGGQHFLHLPPRVQTIENRHGDIYDDHVRLQFAGGTHQGATVAHGSDHVKLCFEKPLAQLGHQIVVVGNQNAGTLGHCLALSQNSTSL